MVARPHHYLVLRFDAEGGIHLLFHRVVDVVSTGRGLTDLPPESESLVGRKLAIAATLLAPDGSVIQQQLLTANRELRGEFHGPTRPGEGWTIDANRFQVEDGAFVVRVPRISGTSLRLQWGTGEAGLDLDDVERTAATMPLTAAARLPAQSALVGAAGNPANRVDILIMGDGYTSVVDFNGDVADLVGAFFDIPPYSTYQSHVNLATVFMASAQVGSDHPPYDPSCPPGDLSCCADIEASDDPYAGTYVDTVFDGRYCAHNLHRLAVVDAAKVLAVASTVPDWDYILVLLNDETYGGSGGFPAVASTHPLSTDIMRHEYGHSFTRLADEYDSPAPGFAPCSDLTGPSCEPNVTDETVPALIKWAPWISSGTPIPTPEGNPDYADDVGLFEGARYQSTGMYRPRDFACLMHNLGQPFDEVCSQAYVLRLYSGGWGIPQEGIDAIEPGTESPPPGFLTLDSAATLNLSVELVTPTSGPSLEVTWLVDGMIQVVASPNFTFDPPAEGLYEIELRVADPTPLVHPEMAADVLESRRFWTVGVSAGESVFADGFEGGDTAAAPSSHP